MISTISVNLRAGGTSPARGYTIMIGYGMDNRLGEAVLRVRLARRMNLPSGKIKGERPLRREKVAVITHPRIGRLYGKEIGRSLDKAGFSPILFQFPEGEQNKTIEQAAKIYDFLIENRFERSSTIIALGGGVVGDMTGFVAATFLRGISYIQCPTTVVGQVDASIGGKTGVDHPKGKNLIGAFHQPSLVFVDPSKLTTLSKREYVAGLAEIVKYGVIYDKELFSFMETHAEAILNRDKASLFHCIKRSVEIKAIVVEKDEKELGLRKILNYGHTFGHAIETLTGYKKYKHGEAVSIGMMAAANVAYGLGIAGEDMLLRQKALLTRLGLPTVFPELPSADIMTVLGSDKKVIAGDLYFVLPEQIGSVCVRKIEQKDLFKMLNGFCLD